MKQLVNACARYFAAVTSQGKLKEPLQINDFHSFAADGSLVPVSSLVWADLEWKLRCRDAFASNGLQFYQEGLDHDQEVAEALVRHAGLKKLSDLVREKCIMSEAESHGADSDVAVVLASYFSSRDVEAATAAICKQVADQRNGSTEQTISRSKVPELLATLKFKSVGHGLNTVLVWLDSKLADPTVAGSARGKLACCYADASSTSLIAQLLFQVRTDITCKGFVKSLPSL